MIFVDVIKHIESTCGAPHVLVSTSFSFSLSFLSTLSSFSRPLQAASLSVSFPIYPLPVPWWLQRKPWVASFRDGEQMTSELLLLLLRHYRGRPLFLCHDGRRGGHRRSELRGKRADLGACSRWDSTVAASSSSSPWTSSLSHAMATPEEDVSNELRCSRADPSSVARSLLSFSIHRRACRYCF